MVISKENLDVLYSATLENKKNIHCCVNFFALFKLSQTTLRLFSDVLASLDFKLSHVSE